MSSVLERGMIENDRPRRTRAQAIAALCVGGMVVARAMADRALADELRAACMAVALKLGGWEKDSESKGGKSTAFQPFRVAAPERHSTLPR
jgi:TetR/AcrR family transcriptional repressor of nem operon